MSTTESPAAAQPDNEPFQPSRALYYPHTEFRSTAWVKCALLYWDGIVRSRPPESSPGDDREIQQLAAAGLIEDAHLVSSRRQMTPEVGPPVEQLMHLHGGRVPPGIPRMERPRGLSAEFEERVRREVLDDLRGSPLAQKAFAGDLGQARTLFYTFLKGRQADALGLAVITDEPIFDAMTTYFRQQGGITEDAKHLSEANGTAIAQLCLPTPSLEALADLPVERLIEIRRKYAEQRHRFRQRVQAEVTAIAQLPTQQAIEDRLKTFQVEIQDDLVAAREAVKDSRARERWTFLGVSAPASMAAGISIAAAAETMLAPVAGLGTVALGVTSWFMRNRLGSAPGNNYLLSLENAPGAPWQRLTRAFRDLVKD
jgi:hypothetical protein